MPISQFICILEIVSEILKALLCPKALPFLLLIIYIMSSDAVIPHRITLAVGSKNPVKVSAAEQGIRNAFRPLVSDPEIVTFKYDVPSGVSAQPMTDDETNQGAHTRAINAYEAHILEHNTPPTFAVGLEGGIFQSSTSSTSSSEMHCCAWMVVFNGQQFGSARTATFQLPPQIAALVLQGIELGAADDAVFKSKNSKQNGGTVGHLTRGGIDRVGYYVPAVELACLPFLWGEMYGGGE